MEFEWKFAGLIKRLKINGFCLISFAFAKFGTLMGAKMFVLS